MKRLIFLGFLAFVSATPVTRADSADADWSAITALDAGPQETINSREDARRITLAFFSKQENALRHFIEAHPVDPHAADAKLRLAHLFATRSDLTGDPREYQVACKLLDDATEQAPAARKPDFAFARVVLAMHRVSIPTDADRDMLTSMATKFAKSFPEDRRVAPLLAEMATMYDHLPKRKEMLLKQALQLTRDDLVRARIEDDLKRISLVGQQVTIHGNTVDGQTIDTSTMQKKVVVAYFFASWSAPSTAGLDEVNYLRNTFKPEQVEVIGICLDQKKEAMDALLAEKKVTWPVIWDGKGWQSPLVRSFSLNAIPTLWVLDRKGRLRTLNARTESEGLIRSLLQQ